jgi:hypothetical protein
MIWSSMTSTNTPSEPLRARIVVSSLARCADDVAGVEIDTQRNVRRSRRGGNPMNTDIALLVDALRAELLVTLEIHLESVVTAAFARIDQQPNTNPLGTTSGLKSSDARMPSTGCA